MVKRPKTLFSCQTCGYQTPRWMGRCPDCSGWNTFAEEALITEDTGSIKGISAGGSRPVSLGSVSLDAETRMLTGIGEFDRVLGGGVVPGSLILIGGDPGIGKSTLMLQVMGRLSLPDRKVLYVSGEESIRQIKLRNDRLESSSSTMEVLSETSLDAVMALVDTVPPDVLVIDSIQTMYAADLGSAPGSVTQVREATMRLMVMAKQTGIPVFLVGHVTKDGAIAGPRIMEHMVDTVLYFEGDRNHVFRILRAVKNRFGSTNEIGVFEMKSIGLMEVGNPSEVFLAERPEQVAGSVVSATMEGTRPILVELQALASSSNLGMARRTILGLDSNRVALLVAVMEKKLGLQLFGYDIFMNVAGGVKIDEPAVDLGIVAAIASSFLDRPIPDGTVVMGEVGLTGEIRGISHVDARVKEIRKMGFSRCLIPAGNRERLAPVSGLSVEGVRSVADVMEMLF
ncbi:MAG: DNA repair protein RadA [Deltaproteobacteria bacterium]|nr:MAG: DNA repair protein RadA [Deltaproteobacteria bacterium]